MPLSNNTPSQATAQDLAWFTPGKYEGLKTFKALDWARLIGDRLNLRRAIDGGNPEAVTGVFETLKQEPLKWLGSDVRYIGADHTPNTATVKSLNLRRMLFLADELEFLPSTEPFDDAGSGLLDSVTNRPDAVVDEILATNPASSFQHFAHAMVSLDAPRAQIIKDFATWLDGYKAQRPKDRYKEGSYLKKAKDQWIAHCAVQYFDLTLYEALSGKEIPAQLRWGTLFPGLRDDMLDSKKKKARSAANLAFSDDTYRLLRHLGHQKAS
ncbi:DUF6387 family protein [Ralstonia chuxiongensis]|uniref:DUF6387 family protein n=1 Tax=Ralstonia chuxiongensis TaxID=2957504 RepID=UPI0028F58E69|nr:DUF6387 family protein [Ralstonia chuxiongensis]CAJ0776263.1 hypothetical protein R8510_04220 [Ralstonia chuxiongensis]